MPALANPAETLGAIVSQLYELAGDGRVPTDQQQQLLLQAHDLRGDLVGLAAMQFTQNTAAYQKVMTNLAGVTSAINQAEADIKSTIAVVSGAGQLAASIDELLKEAAQLAAGAAKGG